MKARSLAEIFKISESTIYSVLRAFDRQGRDLATFKDGRAKASFLQITDDLRAELLDPKLLSAWAAKSIE